MRRDGKGGVRVGWGFGEVVGRERLSWRLGGGFDVVVGEGRWVCWEDVGEKMRRFGVVWKSRDGKYGG